MCVKHKGRKFNSVTVETGPRAKHNKQSEYEYSCKLTQWFCVILSRPMNIPGSKLK